MSLEQVLNLLPAVNAVLISTSGFIIISAVRAVRRGDRETHRRRMLIATGFASVFLVLYLFRISMQGTTPFPGPAPWNYVYYAILITHLFTAVVSTPLVLAALWLGLRGQFGTHRRVARIAYPMWVYVAFTGVFVFGFLHFPY